MSYTLSINIGFTALGLISLIPGVGIVVSLSAFLVCLTYSILDANGVFDNIPGWLPEQKSNQSISWLQDDVDDEKYPGITLEPVVCIGTSPYNRPYNFIWESWPSNNNSN